ncbi:MAG TPA: UPF0175 family protein [Gemmataceae bacterium]|nr:UPF0175 family protein [Gemmataceae bacterium]
MTCRFRTVQQARTWPVPFRADDGSIDSGCHQAECIARCHKAVMRRNGQIRNRSTWYDRQLVNQGGGDCVEAAEKPTMVQMTIDMPEEALAALRKDPQGFAKELRLAAAVKWYELKLLSQERAARVAALSRAEFLDALGRFGVTPFQYEADAIIEEAGRE